MLSYKEAIRKVIETAFPLKPQSLGLRHSFGLVLAGDIFASEPFPRFANSAVDGYALSFKRDSEWKTLKIQGEIPAGNFFRGNLMAGHALRIFTGAPVPRGTSAVIMHEDVKQVNGSIVLLENPKPNANIRFRGEDFPKGALLIKKGTILSPRHLALLAAVGCRKISAYPSPQVSIFATGSELLKAGEPLKAGKIRDCNTILLEALVKQTGAVAHPLGNVADEPGEIRKAIRDGLKKDMLLISGGVSVGKYDFVKELLKKEGVQEIFWKVDIKPGKPLFFGKKGKTLVFGLPGNPVSVFVTFEEFVRPALRKLQGKIPLEHKRIQGYLAQEFQNGSRFHFVRVKGRSTQKGYAIKPLKGQGSHMIGELVASNALLPVKPKQKIKKNQCVVVRQFQEEF
jgi:molybdopterin molybdotransferase